MVLVYLISGIVKCGEAVLIFCVSAEFSSGDVLVMIHIVFGDGKDT